MNDYRLPAESKHPPHIVNNAKHIAENMEEDAEVLIMNASDSQDRVLLQAAMFDEEPIRKAFAWLLWLRHRSEIKLNDRDFEYASKRCVEDQAWSWKKVERRLSTFKEEKDEKLRFAAVDIYLMILNRQIEMARKLGIAGTVILCKTDRRFDMPLEKFRERRWSAFPSDYQLPVYQGEDLHMQEAWDYLEKWLLPQGSTRVATKEPGIEQKGEKERKTSLARRDM